MGTPSKKEYREIRIRIHERAIARKNDLKWYRKYLMRCKEYRLLSCSEILPVKEHKDKYRMYYAIERTIREEVKKPDPFDRRCRPNWKKRTLKQMMRAERRAAGQEPDATAQ